MGGGRARLPPRQEQASPNLCCKVRGQERGVGIAERRANQLCAQEKRRSAILETRPNVACLGSWTGAKILENAKTASKSRGGLRIYTWISAFTSRSNLTISWLQIRTWTSWGAAMLKSQLRRAAAAKLSALASRRPAFRTSERGSWRPGTEQARLPAQTWDFP